MTFMADVLEEFLADDDALREMENILLEDDLVFAGYEADWQEIGFCGVCGTPYDYADSRFLGQTCPACGAFESAWPEGWDRP